MYSTLLKFIVVILIISTGSAPDAPRLPLFSALLLFGVKFIAFTLYLRFIQRSAPSKDSSFYFAAEQKSSLLAVVCFGIDVYLLDCKYYLAGLSLGGRLPSLVNIGGLALFFLYLAIGWLWGRTRYQEVFGKHYGRLAFLGKNIQTLLPIILPWLLITTALDLCRLLPFSFIDTFFLTSWGEPLLILCLFVPLAVTFPIALKRLWGCTPLPAGPVRQHIEDFCRSQNFHYADILLWPLFEGTVLTAGVMGLTRKFRYLLVTPELIRNLTPGEIEAVMAHEIGHVKKHHLPLYLAIFMSFGIVVSLAAPPIFYLLLSSGLFYKVVDFTGREPGSILAFWGNILVVLVILAYLRYIFGFFMRNFERQADSHVFQATGDPGPLIQAFEKIALLGGTSKDTPSWHHFSIGQRIDFLHSCQHNPGLVAAHNRKVYLCLLLCFSVISGSAALIWQSPANILDSGPGQRFIETVLEYRARTEPAKGLWPRLLGDLLQGKSRNREALAAYEKALQLEPDNPEILNNLSWLIITTQARGDDHRYPTERALALAQKAASLRSTGYILDTLATAYWANGMIDKALIAAGKAMAIDPANRRYYQQQMDKFTSRAWPAD